MAQQPGSALGGSARGRRIVLHFDINNTILMKDTAKSLSSVQANVMRIVTKSAWGKILPVVESDADGIPRW